MRWLTGGVAPVSPAPAQQPIVCAACRSSGHEMTTLRLDGFPEPVPACAHPRACRVRATAAGIYEGGTI